MSEFEFTMITMSTSQHLRGRVTGLCDFSQSCEHTSLHPAQGLRVGKRRAKDALVELAVESSQQAASAVSDVVLSIVQPIRQCTVVTRNHIVPEHFLLRTIVDNFEDTQKAFPVVPDVHFIRTQRRYNKRRYARVRAVSRPSF